MERKHNGIGVWFTGDIMDAIAGVDAANWDIAQHIPSREMALYRQGYEAALRAVAASFGISYSPPAAPPAHRPHEAP